MEKKIIIIGFIIILFSCLSILIYKNLNNNEGDKIREGYIAVFNGGSGEVTYSTYIYKIKNDQANYGFDYINTTNTTESWGSSKVKQKITKKGSVAWTDDVFKVAKDNNAYSYVLVNEQKYTIEEFAKMFLMN